MRKLPFSHDWGRIMVLNNEYVIARRNPISHRQDRTRSPISEGEPHMSFEETEPTCA